MASETTSIGLENCEPSSHEDVKSSDIDRALDRAGISWETLRVCSMCGAGWFADGVEGQVLAFMLPTLEKTWNLTGVQLSLLASSVACGQALGAVAWGAASDSFGRRPAFLGSMAVATGFAIASAFAPGFYAYCVLRAATGFGIGGNLPVSIALTAEFLGPKERAPTIVLMHFFYEAGELLTTGLGALLLSSQWRLFLWSTAAPAAAIALLSFRCLPESPHWLASRGRADDARAVVQRFTQSAPLRSRYCAQCEDEEGSGRFLHTSEGDESTPSCGSSENESGKRGLRQLATGTLAPTTAAVIALWFCAQLGSGWVIWAPEIGQIRGLRRGAIYLTAAIARVVAMTAFVFASRAIQGRRPFRLLTFSLLMTLCASAALACVVGLPRLTTAWSFGIAYVLYIFFFGMAWPVMYAVTPLSFPTHARGAGFGVANFASKFGSVLHPLLAGPLIHRSLAALGATWTAGWLVAALSSVSVSRRPTYL